MTSKVYKNEGGQWAFIILDESGVDIIRGAGYKSQEEAQEAADEQIASLK